MSKSKQRPSEIHLARRNFIKALLEQNKKAWVTIPYANFNLDDPVGSVEVEALFEVIINGQETGTWAVKIDNSHREAGTLPAYWNLDDIRVEDK